MSFGAPIRRKANHLLKVMRDGEVHSLVDLGRTWTDHNPTHAMRYALQKMVEAGLVEMAYHERTRMNGYRATEKGIGTKEL